MKHYGRFLPQEKLAQAAEILNEVWETDPAAEGMGQGQASIGLKGALRRLPPISSPGCGYSGGLVTLPRVGGLGRLRFDLAQNLPLAPLWAETGRPATGWPAIHPRRMGGFRIPENLSRQIRQMLAGFTP
jgi:hypothetical protein